MPRNVRAFWIEGSADGLKTSIGFGPKRKDGGFELIIYQRHKGCVMKAARVTGWSDSNGKLHLDFDPWTPKDGATVDLHNGAGRTTITTDVD